MSLVLLMIMPLQGLIEAIILDMKVTHVHLRQLCFRMLIISVDRYDIDFFKLNI